VVDIMRATVTVTPHNSVYSRANGIRVMTSFHQAIMRNGHHAVLQPTISFSAVIPDESRVFNVVMHGEIKDLIRMCLEGEASLTDSDRYGRTLLHVSVAFE
jgi:hypothetical protein